MMSETGFHPVERHKERYMIPKAARRMHYDNTRIANLIRENLAKLPLPTILEQDESLPDDRLYSCAPTPSTTSGSSSPIIFFRRSPTSFALASLNKPIEENVEESAGHHWLDNNENTSNVVTEVENGNIFGRTDESKKQLELVEDF